MMKRRGFLALLAGAVAAARREPQRVSSAGELFTNDGILEGRDVVSDRSHAWVAQDMYGPGGSGKRYVYLEDLGLNRSDCVAAAAREPAANEWLYPPAEGDRQARDLLEVLRALPEHRRRSFLETWLDIARHEQAV